MNIHKNARLTPRGRERLVRLVLSGRPPKEAAEAMGVCERTARKRIARFQAEGVAGYITGTVVTIDGGIAARGSVI